MFDYYQKYKQTNSVVDADFNTSKVIFCGSNHKGLAFYELVKSLIIKGKNIRAVFMEEINSDIQALDSSQNIIDRHFVANHSECEVLKYALPLEELDKDAIVNHLVRESKDYLESYFNAKDYDGNPIVNLEGKSKSDYLRTYYSYFLDLLSNHNIPLGGIDQTQYRARQGSGYDFNRHATMNYHAGFIIKSYIERLNREQAHLQENDVILVSLGNAHTINGFEEIKKSDFEKVAIPSVPSIVKLESGMIPISTISFVADSEIVEKDGYNNTSTIIHKNQYSSYETETLLAPRPPSGSRYTSDYLAIASTDHELDRRISEFADLIVAPRRHDASNNEMVPPTSFSFASSSSSSSLAGKISNNIKLLISFLCIILQHNIWLCLK